MANVQRKRSLERAVGVFRITNRTRVSAEKGVLRGAVPSLPTDPTPGEQNG